MTGSEAVVELRSVSKLYRGRTVLDSVTFEVHAGQIVGLIGPNGSGKTTALRIVAGLVRPTTGDVTVSGCRLNEAAGTIPPGLGVLFDPPGLLPNVDGLRNLKMLASLRGSIREDEVRFWMTRLGLSPDSRLRVGAYSEGMLQRLGLAQAFMESPMVLVLDEPTNALDPETVDLVAELIREQQERGAAILIASHHIEEVERLCNPIWKLVDGRLMPATATDLHRGDRTSNGGTLRG